MEKMFSTIMAGFMKGGQEEDLKKMMIDMCPCLNLKNLSEEEKKALQEKMMSFFAAAKWR